MTSRVVTGVATATLLGLALTACGDRVAGIGETGPVSTVTTATTQAAGQITSILAGPLPSTEPVASVSPSPVPSASDGQRAITLPPAGTSDTLTVWLMPDIPDSVVTVVNKRFEKLYPKVTVNVVRQDWATLQSQASRALPLRAESPDVVEMAAADTAAWRGEGLLADLDSVRTELRAGEWTRGLTHSTQVDGVLSAVPGYGVARVVAYDKAAWRAAGISEPPRSLSEFSDSLAKVQSGGVSPEYSAFWFPGRFWIGALPWIWSGGGELAVEQTGAWVGAVDSGESQAGLLQLQEIVHKYSRAPVDGDETTASGVRAYDEGRASAALLTPDEVESLTKDAAVFALPGVTRGSIAPQYMDGSNLGVSSVSPRQGLAVAWLGQFLSEQAQKKLVSATGTVPGLEKAVSELRGDPVSDALAAVAPMGRFTPPVPQWSTVEEDEVLPTMTQTILTPPVPASASPSVGTATPTVEELPTVTGTPVPASELPDLSPSATVSAPPSVSTP